MKFSVWVRKGRTWNWCSFLTQAADAEDRFQNYLRPEWGGDEVALLEDSTNYPNHVLSERVLMKHGKILKRQMVQRV